MNQRVLIPQPGLWQHLFSIFSTFADFLMAALSLPPSKQLNSSTQLQVAIFGGSVDLWSTNALVFVTGLPLKSRMNNKDLKMAGIWGL